MINTENPLSILNPNIKIVLFINCPRSIKTEKEIRNIIENLDNTFQIFLYVNKAFSAQEIVKYKNKNVNLRLNSLGHHINNRKNKIFISRDIESLHSNVNKEVTFIVLCKDLTKLNLNRNISYPSYPEELIYEIEKTVKDKPVASGSLFFYTLDWYKVNLLGISN